MQTLIFKDDQSLLNSIPNAANISNNAMHSNPNQALNVSGATSSSTSTVEALAMSLKNTEVISILKRRNNSSENVNENLKYNNSIVAATTAGGGSPSINSQTYSDSSLQKYDEDDDESDSDWDGFPVY